MCIKEIDPAITSILVLSDYNTRRLGVENAERIVNSIDFILINKEAKNLPEAINAFLKEG